jgi:hypothetical protein
MTAPCRLPSSSGRRASGRRALLTSSWSCHRCVYPPGTPGVSRQGTGCGPRTHLAAAQLPVRSERFGCNVHDQPSTPAHSLLRRQSGWKTSLVAILPSQRGKDGADDGRRKQAPDDPARRLGDCVDVKGLTVHLECPALHLAGDGIPDSLPPTFPSPREFHPCFALQSHSLNMVNRFRRLACSPCCGLAPP